MTVWRYINSIIITSSFVTCNSNSPQLCLCHYYHWPITSSFCLTSLFLSRDLSRQPRYQKSPLQKNLWDSWCEIFCRLDRCPFLSLNRQCQRTEGILHSTADCQWVLNLLKGSVKEPNILIHFFFPPITQSCSVSDVLFTGGRGVSDFSVLKYY